MKTFYIKPIGVIRSEIKNREDAPLFYTEGAPNASLEISPQYVEGLDRMQVGDELIVITWLHRADRDVLKVHPRTTKSVRLGQETRAQHRRENPHMHDTLVLTAATLLPFVGLAAVLFDAVKTSRR